MSAGSLEEEAWGDQAAHRLYVFMENTVLSTLTEAPTAKDNDLTHIIARAPCCLENGLKARQGQELRAPSIGPCCVPYDGVVA